MNELHLPGAGPVARLRDAPPGAFAAAVLLVVGACGGPEPAAEAPPPSWSPDTATVLFTSSRSGDSEVYVQRGVAGEAVNLTRDPAPDIGSSWTPDGTGILFQTIRDGNREVYRMAADGSEPLNLSRHPDDDLLAETSPDGSRIVFFSTRGERPAPGEPYPGNLWTMKPDGSEQVRITDRRVGSSFGGAWSPDGRSLVFSRFIAPEDTELFVLDVTTGEERRLTTRPGSEGGARYSPDGTRIAYHHQVGDTARIAVMDADGGGTRYVTNGGLHYVPSWSPDGRWLIFTGAPLGGERYDLLAVPVEGGDVVPVVQTEHDERYGSWAPVPGGR